MLLWKDVGFVTVLNDLAELRSDDFYVIIIFDKHGNIVTPADGSIENVVSPPCLLEDATRAIAQVKSKLDNLKYEAVVFKLGESISLGR